MGHRAKKDKDVELSDIYVYYILDVDPRGLGDGLGESGLDCWGGKKQEIEGNFQASGWMRVLLSSAFLFVICYLIYVAPACSMWTLSSPTRA